LKKPKIQKMTEPVSLSQKIYLLGIHPKKGGIVASAQSAMNYVLIGSVLLELSLENKIEFENNRIKVKSDKSENPLHQFVLNKFSNTKKQLKISTWISKLTFSVKHIKKEIQKSLVKKRIIRMTQKRFLIFSWHSPEVVNFQFLYKLVANIETQILKGTENPVDLVMLSFLKPSGLLKRLFPDRQKRRLAGKKINAVMNKNQLSVAVNNAIAASNAVIASVSVINASTSGVSR